MLSERASSTFQRFLRTLPTTVWRLVLRDQSDQVVGVAVIDPSDDSLQARLWSVEGREVAHVARNTPIHELVETLLRAQCTYVQ
jgi:hypothetical protein